jgi:hypothetical protein
MQRDGSSDWDGHGKWSSEASYVGMLGGMHWFGLLSGQSNFSEALRDVAWRAKMLRVWLEKGR